MTAFLVFFLFARAQPLPAGETPIPRAVIRQLFQYRYSVADKYADQRLTADPTDRTASGLKGTVLAAKGNYGAALPLLEAAEGTDFYENTALRYHADALRASGAAAEAAALRQQRLLNGQLSDNHYVVDLLDLVDDYRQLGDYARAAATAERVIGMYPDRISGYAALAEVAIDQGDLSRADELLWQARWRGGDLIAQVLGTEARLLVVRGSPQGALNLLQPWRRKLPRDITLWTLMAESHLALGDLRAAEHILYGMQRFDGHEHPAFLAARARFRAAQGDPAAAAAIVLDGLSVLPGSPVLRAVAEELGVH